MRYPYTRLSPSVPLRPYLKIVLRNGSATTPVIYGLVDSGADYSIFPSDVARNYLKLDLNAATPWQFQGTTGQPQIAFLTTVEVNILNETGTANDFQFSAKIGFCDDFKFGGGVLLGQNGFMSEFKTNIQSTRKLLRNRAVPNGPVAAQLETRLSASVTQLFEFGHQKAGT